MTKETDRRRRHSNAGVTNTAKSYYRFLAINHPGASTAAQAPPYLNTEFTHNPGVYFDKIGTMHPTEEVWKLVIKIDTTVTHRRLTLINGFATSYEEYCKTTHMKDTCNTFIALLNTKIEHANQLTQHIDTTYKTTIDKKRGFIDGIGTLAKSLFGVMDANDERTIKEQLTLLETNQDTTNHAIKTQLHILNATINHINKAEETLDKNMDLLINITERVRQTQIYATYRNELIEHYMVLNTVADELISDLKDIIEYTTHLRNGILHPLLTPTKHIIEQLQKTTTHLNPGTQFPFTIDQRNWLEIEELITINAYRSETNIFTILQIPLITYPEYKIVNIIPLPKHQHENIYAMTQITHSKVAIRKDGHVYITITDEVLQECKKHKNTYVCPPKYPVYQTNENTPCEIKIYSETTKTPTNCDTKYVKINGTIIIALQNTNEWLYSVHEPQQIHTKCTNQSRETQTINKTGKFRLNQPCKIQINEITIAVPKVTEEGEIDIYLPEYNMSTIRLDANTVQHIPEIKMRKIITDPTELRDIGHTIEELASEIKPTQTNIKHILIPTISGSTLTLGIAIIVIIYATRKCKQPQRSTNAEHEQA